MTKDKRVRFTLRLPNNLIEDLKNQANRQGISINALILNILWEWVEKNIENWKGDDDVENKINIKIDIDDDKLDDIIKKANQFVELLKEASQVLDSLFNKN